MEWIIARFRCEAGQWEKIIVVRTIAGRGNHCALARRPRLGRGRRDIQWTANGTPQLDFEFHKQYKEVNAVLAASDLPLKQ